MVTQSDLEREQDEARLKFRRDQNARLRDARLEGEERGLERGIQIGRIHFAEELLKLEPTPQAVLLSMTLEQLRERADRLKDQLAAPGRVLLKFAKDARLLRGDGGSTPGCSHRPGRNSCQA